MSERLAVQILTCISCWLQTDEEEGSQDEELESPADGTAASTSPTLSPVSSGVGSTGDSLKSRPSVGISSLAFTPAEHTSQARLPPVLPLLRDYGTCGQSPAAPLVLQLGIAVVYGLVTSSVATSLLRRPEIRGPVKTQCSRGKSEMSGSMLPQSKQAITLEALFRAIELEKLRSLDETRSPLERTQSMRVRQVLKLMRRASRGIRHRMQFHCFVQNMCALNREHTLLCSGQYNESTQGGVLKSVLAESCQHGCLVRPRRKH